VGVGTLRLTCKQHEFLMNVADQFGSSHGICRSNFRWQAQGRAKAPTGPRKARPDDKLRAVATKAFREALFREAPMSRYRRLKIEGGAFFYTLAPADRGTMTWR
jgi:hypothetical protein